MIVAVHHDCLSTSMLLFPMLCALLLNTDLLDSDLLKSGSQTQIVECAISPFLLLHLCEFCRANGVRVAFGVCYCFLR